MRVKTCTRCKQVKLLEEFWHDRTKPDGRACQCKSCRSLQMKAHREKNPNIYRKKHLKANFNISLEEYEKILESQDGVCAICGGTNRNGERLSVDHNHNTLEIRGLLCANCNMAIGGMYDSVDRLQRAIDYLERNKCQEI